MLRVFIRQVKREVVSGGGEEGGYQLKCSKCGVERNSNPKKDGTPKLPRGWHEGPFCLECWRNLYILRAITFPIAGPADCEWADLRIDLKEAWKSTTQISNFCVTEMAKRDFTRDASMTKMPAASNDVYFYPAARALCPDLSPSSIVSILQSVDRRYRSNRYEVFWLNEASLPRFRYPVPYPVHKQAWRAFFDDQLRPCISVPIGSGRRTLRLRGGHAFRRQLSAFSQIVAGEAHRCELSLYRQAANGSDHRSGFEGKTAGGGQRQSYRVMAKLVAWIPRRETTVDPDHLMLLHTDRQHFWVAHTKGREDPWILNADHVRKWAAVRKVQKQRFSEDMKYEKRWPGETRKRIVEASQKHSRKFSSRIDSFCHEVSAMLAKHAARQRVAIVQYDDSVRDYFTEFPWYKLKEKLRYKLDERGIELIASGDVEQEQQVVLEGDSNAE